MLCVRLLLVRALSGDAPLTRALGSNLLSGTIPSSIGSLSALVNLCVWAVRHAPNLFQHTGTPATQTAAVQQARRHNPGSTRAAVQLDVFVRPTAALRCNVLFFGQPQLTVTRQLNTNLLTGNIPDVLSQLTALVQLCVPLVRTLHD